MRVRWIGLALLVLAVLGVARDPLFWKRYGTVLLHGGTERPLSVYDSREIVPGGNQPAPPRETPGAESLDATALQAAAEYAGARGSRALIVTRHGYIVFEKYWQGTDFDTLVDSGPLARVLTALAIGSALSERKIGWPEEPVGSFIPQWRNDPRGAITIRNLLQLSSGLEAPIASRSPWSAAAKEAYGSDIVPQYLRRPLVAPPGRNWADQSADPDLLAWVIEKATGKRYSQYISQALWQRIGAADAWVSLDRPGGAARVSHGFLAHQGDWMRVAELLLTNGRYQGDEVIVPRWIPQMLEPAGSNKDYGSYLRLGAHTPAGMTPYISNDVFLVEGGGNRLWLVPSLQMAILRTGSMPGGGSGTTPASGVDWDDARIPNLIIGGARDFVPAVARPGGDLSRLVPNH